MTCGSCSSESCVGKIKVQLSTFHPTPSKQEREAYRIHKQCFDHIAGKRSFRDEYNLIMAKKSTLPAACRNFIVEQAKGWEEEIIILK